MAVRLHAARAFFESRPSLASIRFPGVVQKVALFCGIFSVLGARVSGQDTLVWTTNYYLVGGATLGELRAAIERARPSRDMGRMDGHTAWRVAWNFDTEPSERGCRCGVFTTRTTITTTLPRWSPTTNAPAPMRQAWTRYADALAEHEAGHAQFARDAAADLPRRVQALGQVPDCATLTRMINDLGQRVVEEHRQREKDYDLRTRHGATQGARFPRDPSARPRRSRPPAP